MITLTLLILLTIIGWILSFVWFGIKVALKLGFIVLCLFAILFLILMIL